MSGRALWLLALGFALPVRCTPPPPGGPGGAAHRTDPAAVHVAAGASGGVFRDGLGRQLLFRGYNAKVNGIFDATFDDGRTPNEVFPSFDEASAIKFEELGFDVMRLTINWSALEPQPLHYSDDFFAKLDAVLDMARRHHFYVILDMHQDAYSKEIGEDGAPLWAIVPPPAQLLSGPSDDSRRTTAEVLEAGFNFFEDVQGPDGRSLQNAFISAVVRMARRYVGDPAVLGFEAFNEPVVLSQAELDAFHADFADAIHGVDADAPVLFEPIATRNQFDKAWVSPAPFSEGPGVYAVHVYTGWFSVPDQGGWSSQDPSVLVPSMTAAVNEALAWQTPLVVTEFGCDQSLARGSAWIAAELDLQDLMLVSSTAWAWEPGSWGIRHYDDQNAIVYWPDTIHAVARPYPRAVAGDLLRIERPSPDTLVVHYRTTPALAALPHEVSASPDYFTDYTIECDAAPVTPARALGRASFTCPYADGERTFTLRGSLAF